MLRREGESSFAKIISFTTMTSLVGGYAIYSIQLNASHLIPELPFPLSSNGDRSDGKYCQRGIILRGIILRSYPEK